ncbi:MAG: hypothetical protein AAGH99_04980 [Planctomycetota bacterium]
MSFRIPWFVLVCLVAFLLSGFTAQAIAQPAGSGAGGHAAGPTEAMSTAERVQEFAKRVRAESMRKFNEYGGAYIEVNGNVLIDYYTCPWSRLFLVVIDHNGNPGKVEQFILVDKRNNEKYVDRIVQIIEQMGDGDYIVMAVHDSINKKFNEQGDTSIPPRLQKSFARVGIATELAKLSPHTPYIAIGMKGAQPGEAVEVVGEGKGIATGAGTVRYPDVPYQERTAGAPFYRLTVTDAFTGEPIPGAKVIVQQTREFFEFTADERGQVEFSWVGWSPQVLGITAEAPGKAKMKLRWRDVTTKQRVPWHFELALPEGTILGGQVVDHNGEPVPKAYLFLSLDKGQLDDGVAYPYVNDFCPVHADADGRWQVRQAPKAYLNGSIRFSEPGWSHRRTAVQITPEIHRELLDGKAVLKTENQAK